MTQTLDPATSQPTLGAAALPLPSRGKQPTPAEPRRARPTTQYWDLYSAAWVRADSS